MRKFNPASAVRIFVGLILMAGWGLAQEPSVTSPVKVIDVERQPLGAATRRLMEALEFAGSPLPDETVARLKQALARAEDRQAVEEIQNALDPLCLAFVNINPESRVKVTEGPIRKELFEQGWKTFLVKVHNEAGINPKLHVESPNALPVYQQGQGARERPRSDESLVNPEDIPDRFLELEMLRREPLKERLSGLVVEYVVVLLFSRDAGKREATIGFHIGAGTQDLGFRNAVSFLFDCLPAREVKLQIRDADGQPTMAGLVVRDSQNRVYPLPSRRLAPDFFFHEQVYRRDGEMLRLPPGEYRVSASRGPEYLRTDTRIVVPADDDSPLLLPIELRRWIHLAKLGWYSGDHHVHAAGCGHYDSPTEGVGPEAMIRHILGEDLNVGCVLSWGPCWYSQKQQFNGQISPLSEPGYLMRYDVEVSGFPSSHCGHLCLLNLREDDYPGTQRIEEWPSWTVPILKWAQAQGGVVGYSHSGWGLALPDLMPDGSRQFSSLPWGGAPPGWPGKAAATLPDYALPKFDGIGANEYLVAAVEGACDFISTVDTPAIWELNVWYHALNCGLRTRISGETDFPCIYGERVGLGRVYVKIENGEPLNYASWINGLRDGRSYCGDGLSHLSEFRIGPVGVGQNTADGVSTLKLAEPGKVEVSLNAAAWLAPEISQQTEAIRGRRLDEKPYWHLERCRIGQTRNVPVEIIVNGEVVATQELLADGHQESIRLPLEISQSSWVAVRILPSCHTNPIFVEVAGKPICPNRRSAEWCQQAIEICWRAKEPNIRLEDRGEARAAYDRARLYFEKMCQKTLF